MSEIMAPLQSARFEGLVTIEGQAALGQIALRGDLGDDGFRAAIGEVCGLEIPAPLYATENGDTDEGGMALLWMSPDELLLLLPYDRAPAVVADLQQRLGGFRALVVDMSDLRAQIRLIGDETRLREVLAKLTPTDLRADAFPRGAVRRTRLAQIAGGIWHRRDDQMQVFCFRSVADYAFDLLKVAADPAAPVDHF